MNIFAIWCEIWHDFFNRCTSRRRRVRTNFSKFQLVVNMFKHIKTFRNPLILLVTNLVFEAESQGFLGGGTKNV
jgi:hypothetical protein